MVKNRIRGKIVAKMLRRIFDHVEAVYDVKEDERGEKVIRPAPCMDGEWGVRD